ncbi:protein translocase subunit SecD [Nocardioides sp. AE5]|uniref:protein translocase subunit SecD n=1 Tax=Nocardioides sp. AE5 TaxID=2962573 RepID=UPI002880FD46|nr:protein translocase subunit SecD [Nocardioides sp. AE5]MDT0200901.1 protein translocase subunit SecD [Nocardioides sp. AE5]
MSRGAFVRLLLVLGLLAGCLWLSFEKEPRLGIDLRGGSQLMYQAQDPNNPDDDVTATEVDRTLEVLRGRVDSLGVSEPTLVRVGEDRILVELPDVQDPEQAKEVIGKTAQLTVHQVVGPATSPDQEPSEEGNRVYASDDGEVLEVGPVALTGNDIKDASKAQNQNSVGWVVKVEFNGSGSDKFGDLSATAACEQDAYKGRIAIVLDNRIISAPNVDINCGGRITGGTDITGGFNEKSAGDLAVLIAGGALPLALGSFDGDGNFQAGVPMQDSVIGPTLGDAAIKASIEAAVIGLLLTGLFIVFIYRLVGFLATLALASYTVLAYAMTLVVGATLTLPGLAGFVLAIGLAIDANVLVFERAREEYGDNPKAGMRRALSVGFNKAWTAIIDSNVTTLLAALLLFIFASGSVKGFGVTLAIGVIASLVSALIIARVLTEIAVSTRSVARRPQITGLGHIGSVRTWLTRKNPQIMKRKKMWMILTGALTVAAFAGIFVQGLNLGLEFTGGRTVEYSTAQPISADQAREVAVEAGLPEAVVQKVKASDGSERVQIRSGEFTNEQRDEIRAGIAEIAGETEQVTDDTIAASLGKELRTKALIAFLIALAAQMLYLAVRFHWTFALSAVLGLAHDVVLVTGIFAWLGKPIDGLYLAAALTIIGLSVNDTVVVFDRVRERLRIDKSGDFDDISNTAILETMPRTVNTGLGAMFILAALTFMSGDSLQDFSLALLLGLAIGMYSTVCVSAPMASYFQRIQEFPRDVKVKKVRDPNDSGAVV